MSEQLMAFEVGRPLTRVALIVVVALALVGSWFTLRWYLGNTMAENLNPEEASLEIGRQAVLWAPDDPLPHWRLGELMQKKLPPDQLAQAVNEYEKAVSLAPHDYRFWMSLGSALEQSGEIERGEKALRQASFLAPSYAYPRWYLGNLLLRSGRYEESFAELQRASQADPSFRPQLFNLAWELHKNNFESLKTAVGTTTEARAEFALYLINRERFDDGMVVWNGLNESEKRANKATGDALIASLVKAKRYHQAAAVSNDFAPSNFYRVSHGKFINGGFEEDMTNQAGPFGWKVQSLQRAQIGIDRSRSHQGYRSLRILFEVRTRLDSVNLSQLVLVTPATQYEFECYVKTEELQSVATPVVEIIDPMDGSKVAVSQPAVNGNSDWQRIFLSFKTGPKTEALTVRIGRASCGEEPVCPIFGTVWYDDFIVQRRG